MEHTTHPIRRACAVGTTIALIGLSAGVGAFGVSAASAAEDTAATVSTNSTATPTTDGTAAATATPSDPAAPVAATAPTTAEPAPTSATPSAAPTTATGSTATATPAVAPDTAAPKTIAPAASAPTAGSASSAAPTQRAAAVYTAGDVEVTGTSRIGDTITATTSAWPADSTFTYQWTLGGSDIDGATQSTYTITSADRFETLGVTVTGTNADGSATRSAELPTQVAPAGSPYFTSLDKRVQGVAGEPLSYQVTAEGDPVISYSTDMVNYSLPEGVTFKDGLISGTPTQAGTTRFTVEAENGSGFAFQTIDLIIDAGPATGLEVDPYSLSDHDQHDWYADSDGESGEPITVTSGTTLAFPATTYDDFGNPVIPIDDASVSSSDGSDTVGQGAGDDASLPTVTFGTAGTRTILVRADGYSVPVSVTVTGAPTGPTNGAPTYGSAYKVSVSGTVDTPFSFASVATGSPAPTYTAQIFGTLPAGLTFHADGTLTGRTIEAGTVTLLVTATNAAGSATQRIDLTIAPGAAVGVETDVFPLAEVPSGGWFVRSDGTTSGPITVPQGSAIAIQSHTVDKWGNDVATLDDVAVTSDVASDQITSGTATRTAQVVFPHASRHTLRVTAGGVTNTLVVEVQPAVGTVVPTVASNPTTIGSAVRTVAGTTTAAHRDGLAYTGSDDSGLLAWALGLIAAGAAVTVLRFRRRRTQR